MEDVMREISAFAQLLNSDGEIVTSGQDERGREVPDRVPTAPPVGYSQQASLAEFVQRMLKRADVAKALAAEGFDTFEEAGDFDLEDDPLDPMTPYEALFDPAVIAAGEADRKAAEASRGVPGDTPPAQAPAAPAASPGPSTSPPGPDPARPDPGPQGR